MSELEILRNHGDIEDGFNVMAKNPEAARAGALINKAQSIRAEDKEFIRKNHNKPELITTFRPFCVQCYIKEHDLRISTSDDDYRRMVFVERSPERQKNPISNQAEDVGVNFAYRCPIRGCGCSFSFTFADLNDEQSAQWKPPSQQLLEKMEKSKKGDNK